MTNLLIHLFIKNKDSRSSYGKLAGWVGIATNFLLFVVKLAVGIITSSISIMTDAINNLSDSSSSLMTVFGFYLSSKPADEEHPYGHARYEYITALLVSCMVFVIGTQFLISSVKKTIHPESTDFSVFVLVILVVSILVKIWQALFYYKIGRMISSKVLQATAMDSRNDVLVTTGVLIAALLEHFMEWRLDGPVGILISLFLLYSGIQLLRETLTPLIGQAPNEKLLEYITKKVENYPGVIDTHDLIVHNYGPDRLFATIHVELPAEQNVLKSHEMIDTIERDFLLNDNICMVIHLDPIDTTDPAWGEIEKKINSLTQCQEHGFSMHGFRIVRGSGYIRILFDITVPPECFLADSDIRTFYETAIASWPGSYETVITIDRNYISTTN